MDTAHTSLQETAISILDDVRFYLTAIPADLYHAPLEVLSGSTIGQHTRHIIEFYTCLIEQSRQEESCEINYSSRQRDYLIETVPEHALLVLDQIAGNLPLIDLLKPCSLNADEHGSDNITVSSTIGRELIYNIEHTIHHLAIVRIALYSTLPPLKLPDHFGIAPSTIRYRTEACAQ